LGLVVVLHTSTVFDTSCPRNSTYLSNCILTPPATLAATSAGVPDAASQPPPLPLYVRYQRYFRINKSSCRIVSGALSATWRAPTLRRKSESICSNRSRSAPMRARKRPSSKESGQGGTLLPLENLHRWVFPLISEPHFSIVTYIRTTPHFITTPLVSTCGPWVAGCGSFSEFGLLVLHRSRELLAYSPGEASPCLSLWQKLCAHRAYTTR
jgi:hypothetical protein